MDLIRKWFILFMAMDAFAYADYDLTRFLVLPKDITFYYNSQMKLVQLCSPLNSSSHIAWLKNGRRLKYDSRIRSITSDSVKYWHLPNVDRQSIIYELIIDPLLESDAGTYTCRSRSVQEEATVDFEVNITDECPKNTFKCQDSRTCLLISAVCDGNAHCGDKGDESMEVGCDLPTFPHLQLIERSKTTLRFSWRALLNAITYEISMTDRMENKTYVIDGNYASTTLRELSPGTEYDVRIRSISHTGLSKYSPVLKVSTIGIGPPHVPTRPRSNYQTWNTLSFSWDNVKDALSYEVEIRFPNGHVKKTLCYPERPEFLFVNLTNGTTYGLRVRGRSVDSYSNFTTRIFVNTLKLGKPSAPTSIEARVQEQDVMITWKPPSQLANHNDYEIFYIVTYCPLNKVKVQSNGTEFYRLGRCDHTKRINDTFTRLKNLRAFTCYRYTLTTYGIKNIKGGFSINNFTTAMYTTGQPTTEYNPYSTGEGQFSGIVIFGIVTGSLIVLLVLAFFFAYACKWKLLMDAMEEYNMSHIKKDESKSNLSQKSDVLLDNYRKY